MRKLILFFILLIPSVLSLGIAPGIINLNFEPGRVETIELQIDNPGPKFAITITGDLKDYIKIDKNIIETENEIEKINLTIELPQDLDRPGIHGSEIIIREITEDSSSTIKPTLAVKSKIFVHVPYPGKFATAKLKTFNVKYGEEIPFIISVFNLGEEDIKKSFAKVDIFNFDGELINRLTTQSNFISSKSSKQLETSILSSELIPGTYFINATIIYDSKKINLKGSFIVDDFFIKLILITSDDFSLGEIAKFSILLENIGNRMVKGVTTTLSFLDNKDNLIGNIQSPGIQIESEQTNEAYAFWDTSEVEEGKYAGILNIEYEDKNYEIPLETTIFSNRIDFGQSGMTGRSVSEVENPLSIGSKLSLNTALLIMILLIIIILSVYVFKKKKEK